MTFDYPRALPDSIRTRAHERMDAAMQAFVALLSTVSKGRIRNHIGLDIQAPVALLQWLTPDFLDALPPLQPRHIDLLAMLDAHLECTSPRLAGLVDQAIGEAGWVAVSGNQVAVNPCAVVALAARHLSEDPDSDSAVVWSSFAPADAVALRLILPELSQEELAQLLDDGQGGRLVRAQRMLQGLAPGQSPVVGQAAALLRSAMLTLALRDATDAQATTALRPLLDVPEPAGPLWRSARMQEILRSDLDLLRRWVSEDGGLLPHDRVLHAAADWLAVDPLAAVRWMHTLPRRGRDRAPLALMPASAWTGGRPLSLPAARAALLALVGERPESTRELLVDVPASALGGLGWAIVLQIAAREDLKSTLQGVIDEDDMDWSDFDAPGEGSLPALWMRALFTAASLDDHWADLLTTVDQGLQIPDAIAEIADVLAEYASPTLSTESRLGLDESPMSSYAHGLHDAVGEAYGDVWSAADPFSVRKRSEQ
jgi:hypothetical protein